MTEAEKASYSRQFEAAKKRLPRGHVINHCTWRDGQLLTQSGPVERQMPDRPAATGRVRRGAAQEDLFA